MDALILILVAGAFYAGSGVVTLCLARASVLSTWVSVSFALVGSVLGISGSAWVLHGGFSSQLTGAWSVPGGSLVVGVDPLSAFFLVPLFVIGGLCAAYGRGYLGSRPVQAAEFNLLIGAMMLVLVARHALVFLVAWEAMTLLAYVLITVEHGDSGVRRAGWAYLVASHLGVLVLFALFLALGARANGSLDFAQFTAAWQSPSSGAVGIMVLALVGFGVKAGVVGLHVWLPEAHAAAPSHVSALMSAVLIKLGLYGILRTAIFVAPGAWFGAVLMILGISGALFGIVLALTQRDLKRILAYSSIENIGIILVGLGLGFWAHARGEERLAAIAFAGGLLHIWNHAVMKGLMFLGAGSILHGTGTKNIEHLGGLLKKMRWTGSTMIVGAVAIAGLPPLCGFTGEWLIYQSLTELGVTGAAPANLLAMGAAAALALVGGLATLCFVRLVGVALLGVPRGKAAERAHESPLTMTWPMGILAVLCIGAALAAPTIVMLHSSVVSELLAPSHVNLAFAADGLAPVVAVSFALLLAIALGTVLLGRGVGKAHASETWACGYPAPTARMQYSGRGFAELLSAQVLPRWMRARLRVSPPEGPFPSAATFASDVSDPLARATYEPFMVRVGNQFARLRFLQQGNLHVYLLYVLIAVTVGLSWVAIRDWLQW